MSSPDLASMLSIIPPLVSSINPSDPAQKSLSNKIQEASGYFVKLWSQRLSFLARVVDTSHETFNDGSGTQGHFGRQFSFGLNVFHVPQRLGQSALQFESKTPPLEFFLLDTIHSPCGVLDSKTRT